MIAWLPSALVNHLWQSTLCVLLVWLATLTLRNTGARVRFWLWTAASPHGHGRRAPLELFTRVPST